MAALPKAWVREEAWDPKWGEILGLSALVMLWLVAGKPDWELLHGGGVGGRYIGNVESMAWLPDPPVASLLDTEFLASFPDTEFLASLPDTVFLASLPDIEFLTSLPDIESLASLPDNEPLASLPVTESSAS